MALVSQVLCFVLLTGLASADSESGSMHQLVTSPASADSESGNIHQVVTFGEHLEEVITERPDESLNTSAPGNVQTFLFKVQNNVMYKIGGYLALYYYPVLLPLGLIGNTMTLLVMCQKKNAHFSLAIYMAALSLTDNGVLCSLFYAWFINNFRGGLTVHQCCVFVYFIYSFTLCGVLLILAMTTNRFFAVCFPLYVHLWSSWKQAAGTSLGVLVVAFLYNVPHFQMTVVQGSNCVAYGTRTSGTLTYSWVSSCVFSLGPSALLLVLNAAIIVSLRRSKSPSTSSSVRSDDGRMSHRERQLTSMLMLVTFTFVVLTLPMYIRHITYQLLDYTSSVEDRARYVLVYHITQKLYFTNNAINLLLYCLGGSRFRSDLRQLFCCCCWTKNDKSARSSPCPSST